MIDEAHQLTKDAFSALLKTLEEPPEYLKFVLATTDPEKMLPTVLSRCLQFNLRPMAPEVVQRAPAAGAAGRGRGHRRRLAAPAGARGARLDARRAVAHRPGHRLRRRPHRRSRRALDARRGRPGHAAALVRGAGAARRAGRAGAAGRRCAALGLSADGTLEAMAVLLQQMAVQQAVPGTLDATDPDHADALRLAPLMPADETQLLYSIVLQGRGELQSDVRRIRRADDGAAAHAGLCAAAGCRTQRAADRARTGTRGRATRRARAPRRCAAPAAPAVRRTAPPVAAEEPPPWVDVPPPRTMRPRSAAAPRCVPRRRRPWPCRRRPRPRPSSPRRWATAGPSSSRGLVRSGAVAALVRELAQQAGLERIDASTQPADLASAGRARFAAHRRAARQAVPGAGTALGEPLQLMLHDGVPAGFTGAPRCRRARAPPAPGRDGDPQRPAGAAT